MSLLAAGVVVAVTTIAARLSAGSTGDSSGSGVVEGDANLQSVVLLRSIATWQRLDVLPFVCLYAAAALDVVVSLRLGDRAMAFALVSAALHAMCVLVQQWFPLARCAVGFSSVASLADATFVLVTPREHKGVSSICALLHSGDAAAAATRPPAAAGGDDDPFVQPAHWFLFQLTKYASVRSSDASASANFAPLQLPDRLPLDAYVGAAQRGHATASTVDAARLKWGRNSVEVPIPTYLDIAKEHVVAPFFVVQIVSVTLWCLDEYWGMPLMTLVMLTFVEHMNIKKRLGTLKQLAAMARRDPSQLSVYRSGKWSGVDSSELVPGDVVLVRKRKPKSKGRTVTAAAAPATSSRFLCPCDLLVLRGECIVNEALLTGESVPQTKSSIASLIEAGAAASALSLDPDSRLYHAHVLFGGTEILQHGSTAGAAASGGPASSAMTLPSVKAPRGDAGGCIAYVLRTGFYSKQGGLVRTMARTADRVTVNSKEPFLLLGVLFIFALAAAGYVLREGLNTPGADRWELAKHCMMIVTQVVPPELPLELSLAVNTSLKRLQQCHIFCTEPFRVPLAGKVQVCCFDKTGTITSDRLIIKGVAGLATAISCGNGNGNGDSSEGEGGANVVDKKPVALYKLRATLGADATLSVLAGCHELLLLAGEVQGKPMEKDTLDGIGWTLRSAKVAADATPSAASNAPQMPSSLQIERCFPFNSTVKRMSTIVRMKTLGSSAAAVARVVIKGAPEVIETLLAVVPPTYRSLYTHFTQRGFRVIALCYRDLDGISSSDIQGMGRDAAEAPSSATFGGFLVSECPIKKDSGKVIKKLRESAHRVVMITGDNADTACAVARKVSIMPKPAKVKKGTKRTERSIAGAMELRLVVQSGSSASLPEWVGIRGESSSPLPLEVEPAAGAHQVHDLIAKGYSLCVTGPALARLCDHIAEDDAARDRLLCTLAMNVAVWARTSPDQKDMVVAALNRAGQWTMMCGDGTNDVGALKKAHVGVSIINPISAAPPAPRKRRRNDPQAALNAALEDEVEMVKFGDASVASPFTSRETSIRATLAVIRQGRCTLVQVRAGREREEEGGGCCCCCCCCFPLTRALTRYSLHPFVLRSTFSAHAIDAANVQDPLR